jgi:Tfp pilus assembly protein PilV
MFRFSNRDRSGGFTLIEVIIATAILFIGVSAMAALAAVMLTRGRQSKYLNVASTLASEKLEDLNRWDRNAQQICVQPGDTSEGSLTTQVTNPSISCTGEAPGSMNYYDQVSIDVASSSSSAGCGNGGNGCFAETVASVTAGVTSYYTTYHAPSGTIPSNPDGTSNPVNTTSVPSNMTFNRYWMIEPGPTVAGTTLTGTRRITVRVTLSDLSIQPPVSFQMSLVRQ